MTTSQYKTKAQTYALLAKALPAFIQLSMQFPQVFRQLTTENIDYIINDTFADETTATSKYVSRAVNAYIADVILQSGDYLFGDINAQVLPFRLSVDIGKLDSQTLAILQSAYYRTSFNHNYTNITLTLDEDFVPSVEVSFIKQ